MKGIGFKTEDSRVCIPRKLGWAIVRRRGNGIHSPQSISMISTVYAYNPQLTGGYLSSLLQPKIGIVFPELSEGHLEGNLYGGGSAERGKLTACCKRKSTNKVLTVIYPVVR